jgi:hypothetical protein
MVVVLFWWCGGGGFCRVSHSSIVDVFELLSSTLCVLFVCFICFVCFVLFCFVAGTQTRLKTFKTPPL